MRGADGRKVTKSRCCINFIHEQVDCFFLHDTGCGDVMWWGVDGPKRHYGVAVFFIVWCEEGKFFLIRRVDSKLVEACPSVVFDEVEFAGAVVEVFDGRVAAWYRILKW